MSTFARAGTAATSFFFLLSASWACGGFKGDDAAPATLSPPTDAGGDGFGPVTGSSATLDVTVSGAETRIEQGGAASVEVTIRRKAASTAPVNITIAGGPAGLSADALTIPPGEESGSLTLHAAAATPQGRAGGLTLGAKLGDAVESAQVPLDVFVRGPAGAVDTTFGTNGRASVSADNTADLPTWRGAVDEQGRALVVGSKLERLTVDGALDATFTAFTPDRSTMHVVPFGGAVYLCVQGTGTGANASVGLERITTAGALDKSFGTNGFAGQTGGVLSNEVLLMGSCAIDATRSWITVQQMAPGVGNAKNFIQFRDGNGISTNYTGTFELATDATFFSSGWVGIAGDQLVKISSAGAYDPGFGSSGHVTLPAPAGDLAVDATGAIVVAGATFVKRYGAADGSVSSTFADVSRAPTGATRIRVLALSDAKLLVLYADETDGSLCRVTRLLPDGTVDASFGTGGSTDLPGPCGARAIGVQPDGRIVVVGRKTFRLWN